MDPRKFVVDKNDLSLKEIEDYDEMGPHAKIGRWHCHPEKFLVETLLMDDWIFFGTLMVPVTIGKQNFFGVVVTNFVNKDSALTTVVRTANVPVRIDDETTNDLRATMVNVFTNVGRKLNVLSESEKFSINERTTLGHDFSSTLDRFHIKWDGNPDHN